MSELELNLNARIVTVGPSHHGKTTLTRAIARATSSPVNRSIWKIWSPASRIREVSYSTEHFAVEHLDATSEHDDLRWTLNKRNPNGALVIVSATDHWEESLVKQLDLITVAGVVVVAAVVNKVDTASNPQIETAVSRLRESFDLLKLNHPAIIRLSAKNAVEGDPEALESVRSLLYAEDLSMIESRGMKASSVIEAALVAGLRTEILRKRRDGEDAAFYENGQIVTVPSHDLG